MKKPKESKKLKSTTSMDQIDCKFEGLIFDIISLFGFDFQFYFTEITLIRIVIIYCFEEPQLCGMLTLELPEFVC